MKDKPTTFKKTYNLNGRKAAIFRTIKNRLRSFGLLGAPQSALPLLDSPNYTKRNGAPGNPEELQNSNCPKSKRPLEGAVFKQKTKNETLFYGIHYRCESIRIGEREIGKSFTVQYDALGGRLTHELRIAHTMGTHGGVDTLNPQSAEFTLLIPAVAVGIGQPLFNGVFGYGPNVFTTAIGTFGEF
jgi:hypothetical protein